MPGGNLNLGRSAHGPQRLSELARSKQLSGAKQTPLAGFDPRRRSGALLLALLAGCRLCSGLGLRLLHFRG
jgi:hypothetical protein